MCEGVSGSLVCGSGSHWCVGGGAGGGGAAGY